jgi:agmatinase
MSQTQVVVVGVPVDENSSHLRGAARAPDGIRRSLRSPASNLCAEDGLDLDADDRWRDVGDIGAPDAQPSFELIETRIGSLVGEGQRVLALGGDHSITWPLVRGFAAEHQELTIVHLDAHPDLYDVFDGSRSSHACPFARIMEEELATRLVSVGIRAATTHQREQADRFGVEWVAASDDWRAAIASLQPPLYVSLDLDVLDPAFAPGLSHPEPGGLSTRQLLDIIHALPVAPVGADLVELNPDRDLQEITAVAAAKLLKELVAKMSSVG